MNKKILLTTIVLSAITATGAYAMYGTGSMGDNEGYGWGSYTHKHGFKMGMMRGHHEEMEKAFENAPADVKAIIEKKKSGKTITDTEKQTVKDYMQKEGIKMGKYGDKRGRMGYRHEEMEKAFENAPADVKAIIEKKKSGKTITDTEKQTVKDYMQKEGIKMGKYGNKRGRMGYRHEEMQKAFENSPANIKAIIEKKKNGSTLTDTEKQTLRDYMKEHRPPNMHAVKKYKDMIEKKYGAKLDAMSTEQLTNLQSKIKTLSTTVTNSSSYTEDQKRLYSDVLTALDMSIKGRLQTNDASNILDSLFNK